MALSILRACGELCGLCLARKTGTIAQAIGAYIQGRNAVRFERERRLTLLTLGLALPAGTEIHDERAGVGSLHLRLSLPAPGTARRSGQLNQADSTLGEGAPANGPTGVTGR